MVAPVTPSVDLSVVAPVTANVFAKVTISDTDNVEARVVAPVTARVDLSCVAPLTVNDANVAKPDVLTVERLVLPVTTKVDLSCVAPFTINDARVDAPALNAPPTLSRLPIPTPPATTNAPVVVDIDSVVSVIFVRPFIVTLQLNSLSSDCSGRSSQPSAFPLLAQLIKR